LSEIEHTPLRNVLNALSGQDRVTCQEDLRESLRNRGFDPDQLVAGARSIVADGLRRNRLAESPVNCQEHKEKRMQLSRQQLLGHCDLIREEYFEADLTLTLRQMYYQLVARGLLANGQKHYKRVGSVLTDARYSGEFPLDGLEDRGRTVGVGEFTENRDCVDGALAEAAKHVRAIPYWALRRDRWLGQPEVVSVWVEKEALSGVFDKPCRDAGVSLFACKGYPSISALYSWLKQMVAVSDAFSVAGLRDPSYVVLYFGDHDPDGMEIPDSALRNLEKMQDVEGHCLDIEFKRLALNMDQIERYDPPPFPAKPSSSRFESYCDNHGTDDAWELDALDPPVLQQLIKDGVSAHFCEDTYNDMQSDISGMRQVLRARMSVDGWLSAQLAGDSIKF